MLIIPAIDLRSGRCVRLIQGDYDRQLDYDGDPIEVGRSFADAGAQVIHIVDLDGARLGVPQSLDLIERLCRSSSASIEFGGGVRSIETAQRLFDVGVARVVVGSVLTRAESLASELLALGERVVAGIDARQGEVATEGWTEASGEGAVALAQRVEALGARRIILTDIARDGMFTGPNLDLLHQVSTAVSIAVIHSGGIGSMEDLRKLATSEFPPEGVIVGRALYEGRLNLLAAIEEYQQPGSESAV